MKKMIFAMAIATGVLTASFANAQTADKNAPKPTKMAPAKASTTQASSAAATKTKQNAPTQEMQVKPQAAPATMDKKAKASKAAKTTEMSTK